MHGRSPPLPPPLRPFRPTFSSVIWYLTRRGPPSSQLPEQYTRSNLAFAKSIEPGNQALLDKFDWVQRYNVACPVEPFTGLTPNPRVITHRPSSPQ